MTLAAYMPSEDCKLLLRYRSEFPDMYDRFQGFLHLDPEYRPREALRLLKRLIRQEWLQYGLNEQEIADLFSFKRQMVSFDREHRPAQLDPVKTKMRIWVYDTPTVVLGQSRGDDQIPLDDQYRLQNMAAHLVFADDRFQLSLKAMVSIIEEDTPEALWVKDIEKLMLLNHLGETNGQQSAERFQTHWEEFRPSWRTMEGMMASYDLKYKLPKQSIILNA